jgi:hypothetical protein
MWVIGWAGAAWAWDLEETHTLTLPDGDVPVDVAVGGTPDHPRVAVVSPTATYLYDAATGALVDQVAAPAIHVEWAGAAFVACSGTQARSWLPIDPNGTFGRVESVEQAYCGGDIVADGALYALDAGQVARLDTATLEWVDVVAMDGALSYAVRDGVVAALSASSTSYRVLNGPTPGEVETGAYIRDIEVVDDEFVTLHDTFLREPGDVRHDFGAMLDHEEEANADLDGDGAVDLLFQAGGVWRAFTTASLPGWRLRTLPITGYTLAAGSLDEDCARVASTDGTVVRLYAPVGCHGDADGDGTSTESGDCDDANPDVGPDTPEACDQADEDCSGVIDDATFGLSAPAGLVEGQSFVFTIDACPYAQTVARIDVEDVPGLVCPADCWFLDDGSYTVAVSRLDAPDIAASVRVEVANAPPSLGLTSVSVVKRQTSVVALPVFDPGGDDVVVTLVDGPRWVELVGTELHVDARRRGQWDLELRLDDQEGGVVDVVVLLDVVNPPLDCGCGDNADVECATGAFVPGWTFIVAMILLRRRSERDVA